MSKKKNSKSRKKINNFMLEWISSPFTKLSIY